ncbi:hypothetical protein GOV10_01435, partial [Candidatus Woesearchaeota archaeon]|nr:hypothetical protein [Candidatus Woesearchaeota archaeon]
MAKTLLELIKIILPLGGEKQKMLRIVEPHLEPEEYKDLKHFLKMDRLFGLIQNYESELIEKTEWVEFKTHVGTEEIKELTKHVNKIVKSEVDSRTFHEFAEHAVNKLPKLIANNIVGLKNEKFAATLMLFAKEPFHML